MKAIMCLYSMDWTMACLLLGVVVFQALAFAVHLDQQRATKQSIKEELDYLKQKMTDLEFPLNN